MKAGQHCYGKVAKQESVEVADESPKSSFNSSAACSLLHVVNHVFTAAIHDRFLSDQSALFSK